MIKLLIGLGLLFGAIWLGAYVMQFSDDQWWAPAAGFSFIIGAGVGLATIAFWVAEID